MPWVLGVRHEAFRNSRNFRYLSSAWPLNRCREVVGYKKPSLAVTVMARRPARVSCVRWLTGCARPDSSQSEVAEGELRVISLGASKCACLIFREKRR